jgi:hypothetical protein
MPEKSGATIAEIHLRHVGGASNLRFKASTNPAGARTGRKPRMAI